MAEIADCLLLISLLYFLVSLLALLHNDLVLDVLEECRVLDGCVLQGAVSRIRLDGGHLLLVSAFDESNVSASVASLVLAKAQLCAIILTRYVGRLTRELLLNGVRSVKVLLVVPYAAVVALANAKGVLLEIANRVLHCVEEAFLLLLGSQSRLVAASTMATVVFVLVCVVVQRFLGAHHFCVAHHSSSAQAMVSCSVAACMDATVTICPARCSTSVAMSCFAIAGATTSIWTAHALVAVVSPIAEVILTPAEIIDISTHNLSQLLIVDVDAKHSASMWYLSNKSLL